MANRLVLVWKDLLIYPWVVCYPWVVAGCPMAAYYLSEACLETTVCILRKEAMPVAQA
jgi:hypothetical protein